MGVELRFPFTKFLPPALDDRIAADPIIEQLRSAVRRSPLTVITAPAGAGKTTALAAWAATTGDPIAWVRLSPDDDTPTVAAAALLAAVRRVVDGFGGRLEQVLGQNETAASPEHLVTSLVNDLGDSAMHLVLDDFHHLTNLDSLRFFEGLIEHLPHESRLLIASRTEPALSIARLRVRGLVADLGLEDLRLDPAAVRAVLADSGADRDAVEALAAATDGFAAAVRLAMARIAAGAADPTSDPSVLIRPELWRFLAEEVLDAQPADLRVFLLDTSILEELSPAVCAAVTGRPDATSVLAELDKRNLFLARYPSEDGVVWRCHELFAAFLRDRLGEERNTEELAALHRRAADALPPPRAVPHHQAAGDHQAVAALAIEIAFERLDPSVLPMVVPWLEALPPEVAVGHHLIPLLLAWNDEVHGRPDRIIERLEPLHRQLSAAGEALAAAEIGLELASGHFMLGELDRVEALVDEALVQPMEGAWRMAALALRMHTRRERGDWAGVSKDLEEAFDLALRSGDPAASSVLASVLSWRLLSADQGPAWVVERTRRLVTQLESWGGAVGVTQVRPLLAGAALLELDLDRAADETRRCLAESRDLGMVAWTHQKAETILLALALAAGDDPTVRGVTEEAFARMDDSPVDLALRHAYAHAAIRSAWSRRDQGEIQRMIDLLAAPANTEEEIVRAVAEALRARLEGHGRRAIGPLLDAERAQHQLRRWFGVGLPGLEHAAILLEQGHAVAALEAVEPTLGAAAELGAGLLLADGPAHARLLERCAGVGAYPDAARDALAALQRPRGPGAMAVPGAHETLSPREVEVLGHVARGASNRAIAEALYISEVTVKSHLTRILRKLGATSRTHAVARARELHLL